MTSNLLGYIYILFIVRISKWVSSLRPDANVKLPIVNIEKDVYVNNPLGPEKNWTDNIFWRGVSSYNNTITKKDYN